MTELIKVSVDRLNFDEACTNGYVDGIIRASVEGIGMQSKWVYVDLGEEKNYRKDPKARNQKTEYKLFINCYICIAETEEDLDNENWSLEKGGVTVLLSSS